MGKTYMDLVMECNAVSGYNGYNFGLPKAIARSMNNSPLYVELRYYKQVCQSYEKCTGKKLYAEIDVDGVKFYEV